MPILFATDKKKALLAYKDKLLNDIRYYEKRINETSQDTFMSTNFGDSSDSDDECPFTIDKGPVMEQLKSQQNMLRTGLHATQELSSLCILQSRVDILVEDPVLNGEPPLIKPGLWREVNADCRIDLVPFSTTFYIHQANDLFGAKSYRRLKVQPTKPAQEMELSKSVLSRVTTPSDAIEVLRNYSVAYRSRRTSLARLADKYAHNLHMEPLPSGGYLLKCADLLEVSWMLENKWSRVAPFYHKMVFDVDTMDECYIKIIRNAHKQLSEPSTDTNERTMILAKIIATCLEARGARRLEGGVESDTESGHKIEKRHLPLENEAPEAKKMRNTNKNNEKESFLNTKESTNIDDQVMAPPKSLPKKVKPKGKENTDQSRKSAKRPAVENEVGNVKKSKTHQDTNNAKQNEKDKNKVVEIQNDNQDLNNIDGRNKNRTVKSQANTKSIKEVGNEQTKSSEVKNNHNEKHGSTGNVKDKEKVSKIKNSIDKVYQNQNNAKESIKDGQSEKVMKTKNKENIKSAKENRDQAKLNTKNSKENDNVQEKSKKISTDSQKVKNKHKTAASSKTDPIAKNSELSDDNTVTSRPNNHPQTKNTEIQKVRNKDKTVTNSKAKNSESKKTLNDNIVTGQLQTQNPGSKNKTIGISKNDLNSDVNKINEPNNGQNIISSETNQITTQNNDRNRINSVKLVEIDDIPIMSGNNIEIDKVPKRVNNNNKAIKHHKGTIKIVNEKGPKNDNKSINNFAPLIDKNSKNKGSNIQNVKKSIVKETNPIDKLVSSDNPVSKTNKLLKKSSSNNLEMQNDQKTKNNENNSTELKKSNALYSKPTQKDIVKNTVNCNTVNNKEVTTKTSKNNKKTLESRDKTVKNKENHIDNPKVTEKQLNRVITEKVTKHSNAAAKNRDNVVNINKNNAEIEKPKMIIKRFTTSKKTAKNVNESDAGKKVSNVNIGKENDSGSKFTKIPMKLSIHESLKKNNPLRMSPRRLPSTFKSTSDSNMKRTSYFTHIPRLMKNNVFDKNPK